MRAGARAAGRPSETAARGPGAAALSSAGRSADARTRGAPGRAATLVARRDDDLAALIGRIDTAPDIDLVLVVPRQARALREPAVWAHVAAHVRRRGIALGVVSPRGDVRAHARANALRAARTPRGLGRGPWRLRLGSREFVVPRPRLGAATRGALLLVAVALAGVTACYAVPSARIVVVPPSEPFTRSAEVRLQPLLSAPDLGLALIPAISVEREIATTLATTTTGETEIGEERATLVLRFTSEGIVPLELPASTAAGAAAGATFLTDEAVTVPPGGSTEVSATAELPGIDGNVAPGEVGLLGEALPATLTVTNVLAGEGGTNVLVPAVAQEDVDRLRELARTVLARTGVRELVASVEGATVFEETVLAQILSERPQSLLGAPTEVFLMDYTAIASGLALADEAAAAFGQLLLVEGLPEGMALLPGTVEAEVAPVVGAPDGTGGVGVITVTLRATGRIYALPDVQPLRGQLTGVRPGVAASRLMAGLGLEEPPRVTLEPEWVPWRWTPRRASRITIAFAATLDEPDEPDEPDEGEEGEEAEPNDTPAAPADGTARPGSASAPLVEVGRR